MTSRNSFVRCFAIVCLCTIFTLVNNEYNDNDVLLMDNAEGRVSETIKELSAPYRLPQPRRHQMICVVDSVIYLLGGYGKYRVVQSSVDAYDTTSGKYGAATL